MALKRSWPAVSQICAFTVPPAFSVTPFVANSTPMVGYLFFGNSFFMYRLSKCVFPTPVSPTRITVHLRNFSYSIIPSLVWLHQSIYKRSFHFLMTNAMIVKVVKESHTLLLEMYHLRLNRKLKLSSCLVFIAIWMIVLPAFALLCWLRSLLAPFWKNENN